MHDQALDNACSKLFYGCRHDLLFAPRAKGDSFFGHRPHALYSFDQEYKDDMEFWGKGSGVVASIFAPTVAAAKALAMLDKLGC